MNEFSDETTETVADDQDWLTVESLSRQVQEQADTGSSAALLTAFRSV